MHSCGGFVRDFSSPPWRVLFLRLSLSTSVYRQAALSPLAFHVPRQSLLKNLHSSEDTLLNLSQSGDTAPDLYLNGDSLFSQLRHDG